MIKNKSILLLAFLSFFSNVTNTLTMDNKDIESFNITEFRPTESKPIGDDEVLLLTHESNNSEKNIVSKLWDKSINLNKQLKKTIKEFVLNKKPLQITENFSIQNKEIDIKGFKLNPVRVALWLSIMGLSVANWFEYGQLEAPEFDLASLLLGHISAELLETYDDPIRNNPIITPLATYYSSLALLQLDIGYFYKHWKFITGWPLVLEYAAFSTAAFKAIKLIEWFKKSNEEKEEANNELDSQKNIPSKYNSQELENLEKMLQDSESFQNLVHRISGASSSNNPSKNKTDESKRLVGDTTNS